MSGIREQQLWLTSHLKGFSKHPPPALSRENTSKARRAAGQQVPCSGICQNAGSSTPEGSTAQQGVKDGGHVEKRSEEEELKGTPVRMTPQITSASVQS